MEAGVESGHPAPGAPAHRGAASSPRHRRPHRGRAPGGFPARPGLRGVRRPAPADAPRPLGLRRLLDRPGGPHQRRDGADAVPPDLRGGDASPHARPGGGRPARFRLELPPRRPREHPGPGLGRLGVFAPQLPARGHVGDTHPHLPRPLLERSLIYGCWRLSRLFPFGQGISSSRGPGAQSGWWSELGLALATGQVLAQKSITRFQRDIETMGNLYTHHAGRGRGHRAQPR